MIAKTMFGLEEILADELRECGAKDIEPLTRAVAFTGVFDGSISIIPALLALLFLAAFMFVLIRKYKALYC